LIRDTKLGRALAAMFPAAEIMPVSNAEEVRHGLEANLYRKSLPVIKFRLASLRSFLWWERTKNYKTSDANVPEEGSGSPSTAGDSIDRALSAYVGTIIQSHMNWVWNKLKIGNSAVLGRIQMQEKLKQLWFAPTPRDHVFISPEIAAARRSDPEEWSLRQSGYLDYAMAWFNHYYD